MPASAHACAAAAPRLQSGCSRVEGRAVGRRAGTKHRCLFVCRGWCCARQQHIARTGTAGRGHRWHASPQLLRTETGFPAGPPGEVVRSTKSPAPIRPAVAVERAVKGGGSRGGKLGCACRLPEALWRCTQQLLANYQVCHRAGSPLGRLGKRGADRARPVVVRRTRAAGRMATFVRGWSGPSVRQEGQACGELHFMCRVNCMSICGHVLPSGTAAGVSCCS